MPKPLSILLKILLVVIFPPSIVFLIVYEILKPSIKFASQEKETFSNLVNNPNEENARAYVELMQKKPKITFLPDDNPNSWAVLREKWQIINHSNKISSGLKKEILNILIARGLYVNNSNIVNNYSGHDDFSTGDDEMLRRQNEWAMEEARKAATPFDHGGYVQGDGFNPSDTMAADAQRQQQAEQMNHMNDMNNMNNMGGMGMF